MAQRTFNIPVSNGILTAEHRQRIGTALWEFLWSIDRTTKNVERDGQIWGAVLGGRAVTYRQIAEESGSRSIQTTRKHVVRLVDEGYWSIEQIPGIGICIWVANPKKRTLPKKDQGMDTNPAQKRPGSEAGTLSKNGQGNEAGPCPKKDTPPVQKWTHPLSKNGQGDDQKWTGYTPETRATQGPADPTMHLLCSNYTATRHYAREETPPSNDPTIMNEPYAKFMRDHVWQAPWRAWYLKTFVVEPPDRYARMLGRIHEVGVSDDAMIAAIKDAQTKARGRTVALAAAMLSEFAATGGRTIDDWRRWRLSREADAGDPAARNMKRAGHTTWEPTEAETEQMQAMTQQAQDLMAELGMTEGT